MNRFPGFKCYAILLLLPVIVLSLTGLCMSRTPAPIDDNMLLAMVLTKPSENGGYTVVKPVSALRVNLNAPADVERVRKYILERVEIQDYDLGPLVDLFFQRNQVPAKLTLASSPQNGYIVDHDGKYAKYFEKDGGGWARWRKENPRALSMTEVSLPAFDPKAGILLVYIGTDVGPLAGSGHVFAYRYEERRTEGNRASHAVGFLEGKNLSPGRLIAVWS